MKLEVSKNNEVQDLVVKIKTNTIQYTLNKNSIVNFDIEFKNNTLAIMGTLVLTDELMFNAYTQFKDCVALIEYLDKTETLTQIIFKVISVQHLVQNDGKRNFLITLQDAVSYSLQTSYLGKTYGKTNLKDVLEDYLKELEVPVKIDGSLELDSLVVPKHINNLRFFEEEALRQNANIYQDRNGIHILSSDDSEFKNLILDDMTYTNEYSNKEYFNNILEYKILELNRLDNFPEFRTMEFDFNKKEYIVNDDNSIEPWSLNDLKEPVLETKEYKTLLKPIKSHKERVRRNVQDHYGLNIIVNGYAVRNPNMLVHVRLAGNITQTEALNEGDASNSGVYIVAKVQEKYIGGVLIQRLFLRRPDSGKVLEIDDDL